MVAMAAVKYNIIAETFVTYNLVTIDLHLLLHLLQLKLLVRIALAVLALHLAYEAAFLGITDIVLSQDNTILLNQLGTLLL